MAKQYSFKTTRRTQQLEEVLERVPKKDRSEFIREMLIKGMEVSGHWEQSSPTPSLLSVSLVPPTEDKGVTKEDESITIEAPKADQSITKEDKGSSKEAPSPPLFSVIEEEDDLEEKLDNLYD
jgi:hypothetical protein